MKHAPLCLFVLICAAASAVAGDLTYGPRLGYTHDRSLDQFHFGAHATVWKLSANVSVVPSLELGFGDGRLLACNGDVIYEFTELASARWSYYAGGGPLLSRFTRDRRSSTDFALSLVAGVTRELRSDRLWFLELRIGLEDAPALKITTGLTFF